MEILKGKIRRRHTVRRRTTSNRLLRLARTRYLRRAEGNSAVINRQRLIQTPVLKKTSFSVLSRLPVTTEMEAAYRNGINYYTGNGVKKNKAFAYMWLNFAMAEGHPVARSALMRVSRSMTRSELVKAREQAKIHTRRPFLNLTDHTKTASQIRNEIRRKDLQSIMDVLTRYYFNNAGQYPDKIPLDVGLEICTRDCVSCFDMYDLRSIVPTYLLDIPVDPFSPVDFHGTGYMISKDKDDIITIYSKFSEGERVEVKSE